MREHTVRGELSVAKFVVNSFKQAPPSGLEAVHPCPVCTSKYRCSPPSSGEGSVSKVSFPLMSPETPWMVGATQHVQSGLHNFKWRRLLDSSWA